MGRRCSAEGNQLTVCVVARTGGRRPVKAQVERMQLRYIDAAFT